MSVQHTTNSSPPSRTHTSPSRTRRRAAACATWTSSSSPAAWPSMSLTRLKPSRSMNSNATPRAAAPSARERGAQLLDEQRAAPEAGEPVVGRVVLEPLLEHVALGDVFERAEVAGDVAVVAAQRNRPRAHPARRAVGHGNRSSDTHGSSRAVGVCRCAAHAARSSGWIARRQPSPSASAAARPVSRSNAG